MYLINVLGSAHEKYGVWTGPKIRRLPWALD